MGVEVANGVCVEVERRLQVQPVRQHIPVLVNIGNKETILAIDVKLVELSVVNAL